MSVLPGQWRDEEPLPPWAPRPPRWHFNWPPAVAYYENVAGFITIEVQPDGSALDIYRVHNHYVKYVKGERVPGLYFKKVGECYVAFDPWKEGPPHSVRPISVVEPRAPASPPGGPTNEATDE